MRGRSLAPLAFYVLLGALPAGCGGNGGGEDHPGGECRTDSECDDGDPCTDDRCDPRAGDGAGLCRNTWVTEPPATEGPPGDSSCGNGRDDDCDGDVDSADADCQAECTGDGDCDDGAVCTRDRCNGGACAHENAADGLACDDGLDCTTGDACLAGACTGTAVDCSHLDEDCIRGECDESLGGCAAVDREVGAPCIFVDFCSSAGQCIGGACVGINDKDADGDGRVDVACPGGSDCDDADPAVRPEGVEAPAWGARCADLVDNDCDGRTDSDDPTCWPGPGLCDGLGWCWENPQPQGRHLNAVWAFGPDDLWAVGDSGTILRWDGTGWYLLTSQTGPDLFGLWAAGPDDLWISERYGAQRWNRDGMVRRDTFGDGYLIWGSSATDVWVGGGYYAHAAML
jgi:hypothetical protein